jgi:hypothetical protein
VCLGGLGRSTKTLDRGLKSLVVELEGSSVSNPLNLIDLYIVLESSSVSNRIDIVEVLGGN